MTTKIVAALLLALAVTACENCHYTSPDAATQDDAGDTYQQDAGPPPAPTWCYQPPHASGPTDDQCFSSLNDCEAGRAYWGTRASECWLVGSN
jgi:hypothetical protein